MKILVITSVLLLALSGCATVTSSHPAYDFSEQKHGAGSQAGRN